MKSFFLPLLLAVLFAACSQESGDEQEREQVIKIETKIEKSSDKDGALICLDEDGKITCKLMTKRCNRDRSVEFSWLSPTSPKDDREHAVTLPANHASVFDVRYKEGRVKGKWTVTAEIDDEEVSASFRIQ